LIAPVEASHEFANKFFPKAWEAVRYEEGYWGYPIAMETMTLMYNKLLLEGPPPEELSQLVSINKTVKKKHPGVTTILLDYYSAYYSWGILASAGGYVYGNMKTTISVHHIRRLLDVKHDDPFGVLGMHGVGRTPIRFPGRDARILFA